MSEQYQHYRKEYLKGALDRADLLADPIEQYKLWLVEAGEQGLVEPNAVVLATADAAGSPAARVVLLKEVSAQGLVFFTNYQSRKGQEIEAKSKVALLSYWPELERQVRIEGTIEKVERAISEKYFAMRPRGSQLAASISNQSQTVPDRLELESKLTALENQLGDQPVPCPQHWGGYRVRAAYFEFWQGRENKLHDRFRYLPQVENSWQIQRLAP